VRIHALEFTPGSDSDSPVLPDVLGRSVAILLDVARSTESAVSGRAVSR
jgi:hypothetical protein